MRVLKMQSTLVTPFSLAPGFSPVLGCAAGGEPFQRLFHAPEAAKAAEILWPSGITGLKPGANKRKAG
jgi:hypothetical protein